MLQKKKLSMVMYTVPAVITINLMFYKLTTSKQDIQSPASE